MIRAAFLLASLLAIAGCDTPPRNNPAAQVEDFKTCKDAGMRAYLNLRAEVMCAPPLEDRQ